MPAKSFRPMFSVPRGFMEMHILRILQNPHHGYEIIKHIEQECSYWKPSPGSVYPILRKLRKSRLISEKTFGKRKVYILTKAGREKVKKFDLHKDEVKGKMIALFRLIGEDVNKTGFGKDFEIFERIRKDPAKLKKAVRLKEEFHRRMTALAED
ncbi:MAG TPA: PadR family transcriptional regulator [archaeon]|nr:PadR family transcriptional regulator [archaeon]